MKANKNIPGKSNLKSQARGAKRKSTVPFDDDAYDESPPKPAKLKSALELDDDDEEDDEEDEEKCASCILSR